MNESLVNIESDEIIKEPKLFGLSRSTAGALAGVFLFLLTLAISWSIKLTFVVITLLSPGIIIRFMISPWIDLISTSFAQSIASISTIFGISIIPPAILGLLLISKDKTERTNGIIMLVLYLIIVIALGSPMYAIYSDW